MSTKFDVIVAGSYSLDLIFSGMEEPPQLGKELQSKAFLVTPGAAFISAVSLHRLGFKVGWAGDFGNDKYSLLTLKYSRQEGLDESLFVFHDRPYRRISVSFTYPADRGFLTYYDTEPKIPATISGLSKSNADLLLIPGLYSGAYLHAGLKLIRMKKMKVLMDGNSSSEFLFSNTNRSKNILSAIKSVDIFLPNANEAICLTGEQELGKAAERLGSLCPLVVIKDGANGSIAYKQNSLTRVPGIPITPVDTTGAGDNFNSGFIRAWFDGLSIENCLRWGNIAGGLSTTQLGGTTWMITVETIKESFSKYYTA